LQDVCPSIDKKEKHYDPNSGILACHYWNNDKNYILGKEIKANFDPARHEYFIDLQQQLVSALSVS
jgi:hypothetical protein